MGNFAKQQEIIKDAKEKEKTSRETLGKFFYDLAKIVFTALVVGNIFTKEVINWTLIITGGIMVVALAYIGYRIIKN